MVYSSWGCKELDTTERLSQAASRALFSREQRAANRSLGAMVEHVTPARSLVALTSGGL